MQRLKTQLNQYTDLGSGDKEKIENLLPEETLRSFKGVYLDTARRLEEKQAKKGDNAEPEVQQLDFEFVLFASAVIDYDYIMQLIAQYTQKGPSKKSMSRAQLISLLCSSANLLEEREDIVAYINTLEVGKGLSEKQVRDGYENFKEEKANKELAAIAQKHGLETAALKTFVAEIMSRMIFDGEKLNEVRAPLELGWKDRTTKELVLMEALVPVLKKMAEGREISGLKAYE